MSRRTIVSPEGKKIVHEFSAPESEKDLDQESPEHTRALLRAELRSQFVTLAEQLAESTLFFRNYKYKGADKEYPDDLHALQRFVTKCFPHAKNGMLLVDEPKNEREAKLCFEKQIVLKKLGFRHVVIQFYEGLKSETTLHDCMKQLGEI